MKKTFIFITAAILIAAAASTRAGETDPGRLFASVPTPPTTLKAAASQIKITGTDRLAPEAPAYDTIIREIGEKEKAAGTAAEQQQVNQMGLNIDFQRMQNDPAYAAKVQAQMQGMSDAEKMAAVQRWQAAQSYGGQPSPGLTAHAKVIQSFTEQKSKNDDAFRKIIGMKQTAMQADADAHAAVDKAMETALGKCPYDNTGMEKAWSCAGPLKEEALRRHREAAGHALADENAVFAKARAIAKARVDDLLPLMKDAEQGGSASDVAMVSGQIGEFTRALAHFGRAITLRAAFWGEPGLTSDFINSTQLRYTVQAKDKQVVEWPSTDAE